MPHRIKQGGQTFKQIEYQSRAHSAMKSAILRQLEVK